MAASPHQIQKMPTTIIRQDRYLVIRQRLIPTNRNPFPALLFQIHQRFSVLGGQSTTR